MTNKPVNIIDESGILAISTRLQRLSEQLRKDGAMLYKAFGIEFEPKWFPVIYTLQFKSPLSILELANEIGYSHPSTISLLKELEHQKLISSIRDKADDRKRLIMLTGKAWELIEQMKPVWEIMIRVLSEITQTTNKLMNALNEVDEQIQEKGFYARAISLVEAEKEQQGDRVETNNEIEVELVGTVEGMKTSNAIRKVVLAGDMPDANLLAISKNDAGLYFLATVNDLPAGTCSCHKTKAGNKIEAMAVLEQYRGLGVGKALIRAMHKQKIDNLYLYAPLALVTWYEKLGFHKKGKQMEEHGRPHYKMIWSEGK